MPGKSKYYEIKEWIEEMILQGEFPPGRELPSEPKLAKMFNASRGTIRQALGALERDAVIARRSGIGTLVIREPKEPLIVSFTEQVRAVNMVPSTEVLKKETIMASEAGGRVCEAFLLDPEKAAETPVHQIDRLRCGDGQPLARQIIYLLAEDFRPELLEEEAFTTSIFTVYARYHRRVAWADEIILARPATPAELDMLRMHDLPPQQQFVYVRDRISHDQENRPLEVLKSVDRSDFFRAYRYRILEEG